MIFGTFFEGEDNEDFTHSSGLQSSNLLTTEKKNAHKQSSWATAMKTP